MDALGLLQQLQFLSAYPARAIGHAKGRQGVRRVLWSLLRQSSEKMRAKIKPAVSHCPKTLGILVHTGERNAWRNMADIGQA